eukprot:TRINITY_DN310_c0_g3_i4.p1 TRINITY_DN310_c0_g3~~TRINITY_DN310_c0_g3_i4.p1  ORF type:complete len:139 (+),score=30.52 TRINITY_DN310_c0_g3_i4:214-630(+)
MSKKKFVPCNPDERKRSIEIFKETEFYDSDYSYTGDEVDEKVVIKRKGELNLEYYYRFADHFYTAPTTKALTDNFIVGFLDFLDEYTDLIKKLKDDKIEQVSTQTPNNSDSALIRIAFKEKHENVIPSSASKKSKIYN